MNWFELLALLLFVPVIAMFDFIIFGLPASMNEHIKKRGWFAYIVPTFLEFFFLYWVML